MKVVTINSNQDIFVCGSMYTQNVLKEGQTQGMNLNTMWTYTKVLIRQGIHEYPSEMAEWKSVKDLAERYVLTISAVHEDTEAINEEAVNAVKATEKAEEAEKVDKAVAARKAKKKAKLEELAEASLED